MTRDARRGITTVECLMALMVFTVGVLGAAGALSLAIRVEMAGANQARAARWTGNVLDSLRADRDQAAGSCAPISSGWLSQPRGLSGQLVSVPVAGGRVVELALDIPSIAGVAGETVWTFIPCR
jgi:Tfp pilus assembly protein PilV